MKMNGLIPMLPVTSMRASVEFYEKLGFGVEQRNDGWGSVPDLDVTFCGMTEFRLDDPDGNRFWIGQSTSTGKGAA